MIKYYYLYEIFIEDPTSGLNGHYYYGKKESTKLDDEYFGSGKLIRRYIKKYGTFKLRKTILGLYPDRDTLNKVERRLIDEKRAELGPLCLNMHEGGSGGHWVEYCSEEEYNERCRKVKEGMQKIPQEIRSSNAQRAGLAKRNVSPERKAEWRRHYQEAHANKSPEEKRKIYSQVASSLKDYYSNPKNKDEVEQRRLKNKQSNIESSKKWRAEFYSLFHRTPESFRNYGKMKIALELYKKIKDLDKLEAENEVNRFMESIN